MEVLKKFWRKLSYPLENTLNKTPNSLRYRKYHEIGKETTSHGGVSFIAAVCITVNLLMGSGFLALPALINKSGLVLGPVTLLFGAILMKACVTYEAEAMCRAEALTHSRLNPSEFEELQATPGGKRLLIKAHAFSVVEMCELFGGTPLKLLYTTFYSISLITSLIGYATVFATAMSSYVPIFFIHEGNTCSLESELYGMSPGCNQLYVTYTFLFSLIVIPISLYDIKEQVVFQMVMTFQRFALVIFMVGTTVYASLSQEPIFGATFDSENAASLTTLFDWPGIAQVLPAAIFSLTLNSYLPIVVEDMNNKSKLGGVISCGILLTCLFYILIGASVAYYFASSVADSCNVNWAQFVGAAGATLATRPLWASVLSGFVILFPCLDVLSVYPLNVINIAKYLMAVVYHDHVDKAETDRFIVRFFRLAVGIPPIIVAFWASDFTVVLVYAGITAIPMSMIIPPYLNYLSKKKLEEELDMESTKTPYTGLLSRNGSLIFMGLFGCAMFLGTTVQTTLGLVNGT